MAPAWRLGGSSSRAELTNSPETPSGTWAYGSRSGTLVLRKSRKSKAFSARVPLLFQ